MTDMTMIPAGLVVAAAAQAVLVGATRVGEDDEMTVMIVMRSGSVTGTLPEIQVQPHTDQQQGANRSQNSSRQPPLRPDRGRSLRMDSVKLPELLLTWCRSYSLALEKSLRSRSDTIVLDVQKERLSSTTAGLAMPIKPFGNLTVPTQKANRSDLPSSNSNVVITHSTVWRTLAACSIELRLPMIADAARAPTMMTTRVVIVAVLGVAVLEAVVIVAAIPRGLRPTTSIDTFLDRMAAGHEAIVNVVDGDRESGENADREMMKGATNWWVADHAKPRKSSTLRWRTIGVAATGPRMAKLLLLVA